MGKSMPSPPPQPDPKQVAAAQQAANIGTVSAQSIVGNANQYGPYGQTTFNQIGTMQVPDSQGNMLDVPRWEQITKLDPAQQKLLDQQNLLSSGLNQLALDQTGRINNLLGQPIQAPHGALQTGVGNVGQIQGSVQQNMAPTTFGETAGNIQYDISPQIWDKYTQSLLDRISPLEQQDREALNTRLLNQGFTAGSQGFNTGMDELSRQINDARLAASTQGFGAALQAGQFNNAAQQQDYGELLGRGQFAQQGTAQNNQSYLNQGNFANAAQNQQFNQGMSQAQLNNQAYAQQLQTDLALRNQPINEISALMNGGQVTLPQFQGYQAGQVANTPIGDYYMTNAQIAAQNYQAQLQARQAQMAGLYGGIGSVLGAGLYGLGRSDRRAKTGIRRIGEWFNGLPLYLFRYIDDPLRRIFMGFMAQDVEKVMPEAVVEFNGVKHVNYVLAMRG